MSPLKKIFLALVAFPMILTSCSKDNSTSNRGSGGSSGTTADRKTLIIGDWLTIALTVNPPVEDNGTLVTDYFAQLEPCTQDDIVSFTADSTFLFTEGTTKCDTLDQQLIDFGTYKLDSNNNYVVLTSNTDINYLKILSLTKTEMKVKFNETDMGIEYTFTQTLIKN